jgi:uncharacterized ion transporter superfamily protein YfcC
LLSDIFEKAYLALKEIDSNHISSSLFGNFNRMKNRSFPNALTIIVAFILGAGALTYIIPKGKYERVMDANSKREVVVPGSYKTVQAENLSPFEILLCIPRGISKGVEVMVLIFLVGGCLFIVEKTGALTEGVFYLTSRVKGKEGSALVLVGFLFVLGGATEGMEEEVIPLIPAVLVFTRSLGYSPLVAVGISYGSAVIGASFSPINPFGAVIAQKVAEVSFLSNGPFRMIVFATAFLLWMIIVIRYANKHRIEKQNEGNSHVTKFSNRHISILCVVIMAFIILIYGMLSLGWGFNEISAEFFAFAILIGLIGKLGLNGTFISYIEGLQTMTFAAMIGGLAYGIPLVLEEGLIIDSIIYGLFTPLQYVPSALSAIGMMLSQALLHPLVPSYSGQAVLTMPILAPLSDLIGLSRDVCVMAFQYGAVLMNMISPTNGALMAIITIAGVSYDEWFKFILKRLLLLFILATFALLIATMIGL